MFRADEHWQEWAKLALAWISEIWGGVGFILVPYEPDGSIAPKIVAAVVSYDPDHIVAMHISVSDWECIAPGSIAFTRDGKPLGDDERADMVNRSGDQTIVDNVAEFARRKLSERCTPLRESYLEDKHDIANFVRRGESSSVFVSMSGIEDFAPQRCLVASTAWASSAALMAAVRTGLVDDSLDKSVPTPRPEPSTSDLWAWTINPGRARPPAELIWPVAADLPYAEARNLSTWLRQFDPDLMTYTTTVARHMGGIVVGDSAADFALALIYDRVLGYGLWLPSTALGDADLCERTIRPALESKLEWSRRYPQRLQLTSVTLDDDAVTEVAKKLIDGPVYPYVAIVGQETSNLRKQMISIGRPDLRQGRQGVAIHEPLGAVATVPIVRDEDGTVTLQAPLPSLLPAKILALRDDLAIPYWLVEVMMPPSAMPEGRGLSPRWLHADDPSTVIHEQVRVGREGSLTYRAHTQGLMLVGSNLESRIARPRLRQLGIGAWVAAVAADHGLESRLSNPGTQAQLVARRLGGRATLLDLISSEHLDALRQFALVNAGTRTDRRFPDGDGIVLSTDPYPAREALSRASGASQESVGELIDQLTSARLLRRGLILGCLECGRPSFVGIDNLGQAFNCQRCAAVNELTSARWRGTAADPRWYYDLHPSFRELLGAGGDVVLLAAAHLRKNARRYFDVAEMEFHDSGETVAEVDLIALVDGEVVMVEAKKKGGLGTGKQRTRTIGKKLRISEILRVDSITLATSDPAWAAADVDKFRNCAAGTSFSVPEIQTLTGLGVRQPNPDTSS